MTVTLPARCGEMLMAKITSAADQVGCEVSALARFSPRYRDRLYGPGVLESYIDWLAELADIAVDLAHGADWLPAGTAAP